MDEVGCFSNLNPVTLHELQLKLQALDCPFVEDGGDQWMAELLLHPSEMRTNLLTWAVIKFDNKFQEVIDRNTPAISNRIDSRHQKLLFICNLIGVCRADDLELIRGTASQKKQLKFWGLFVDMMIVSDRQNGNALTKEESNLFMSSRPRSSEEDFTNSMRFLDTLLRENKMADLFTSEVHLFPPDMERALSIDDKKSRPPVPDLKTLMEASEKMSAALESSIMRLKDISEKHSYELPDQGAVETYCRRIDLALKTFSQMVDSFVHCYEADISVWCNKPKPTLSGLGPSMKSVHTVLSRHKMLTDGIQTANESMSELNTKLKRQLSEREPKQKDIFPSTLDTQDMIKTLEESQIRRKHSSKPA